MSDPQQEYTEALAAYRDAVARLQEAKRHIPPSPQDRWKQRRRERREAARAAYLANKAAIDAKHGEWANKLTAKALQILHHKVNAVSALEQSTGTSVRVRMPITYTVSTPNEPPDHE